MRVEHWSYSGVLPDGTFENDPQYLQGQVHPEPRIATSGNHHMQTPSTIESGRWMSVSTGILPDGTMQGITIYFKDEEEMREFERTRVTEATA